MKADNRVLFGPLAACILTAGIAGLALLVPNYSQIRQTVSEIGEMDSPARVPFAAAGVGIFFALIWISIAPNLSSLFRHGIVWAAMKPVYGVVQRSLFAAWFGWCAGIGLMLWQRRAAAAGI